MHCSLADIMKKKKAVMGPIGSRLRAHQFTAAFFDFIGPMDKLSTTVRADLRLWAFLPWA
jgi:hypothetical protein